MATRRNLLRGAGVAVTGALAGCTSSSGQQTVSNETQGDGSMAIGGASASVEAFVDALEAQGVDVDSTMPISGDVSLMYWHVPGTHRADITIIADVFVQHRTISSDLLNVTAIAQDGTRRGGFSVKRAWADARASGDLSVSAYHQRVLDTWLDS